LRLADFFSGFTRRTRRMASSKFIANIKGAFGFFVLFSFSLGFAKIAFFGDLDEGAFFPQIHEIDQSAFANL